MRKLSSNDELFISAIHSEGLLSEDEVLEWVRLRIEQNKYSVDIVSLDNLKEWVFDINTGNLGHSSGKFFQVQGVDVEVKSGIVKRWQQPIINQPEIGILGFIAKRFKGILHLLVQAKMEPGNINFVQISPTVQATRSNYTQVHGGKRPAFIEYFLEKKIGRVLLDQLQSEQGTRYLRKRNRNVIILLPDDLALDYSEDYLWITVSQLQKLMIYPNLVHMDCRSILGSIYYRTDKIQLDYYSSYPQESFNQMVRASAIVSDEQARQGITSIISWLTSIKCQTEIKISKIPLHKVAGWGIIDGEIKHEANRYFSVVGVTVTASNREVSGWSQPLIKSIDGGIIGLVSQVKNGVLHFIIQGRVEPGLIDIVELAPTVQYTPANYGHDCKSNLPAFVDFFVSVNQDQIRFDSMLSDEGGRFYKSQQRHLIIELPPTVSVDLPEDYCWMTLQQIQSLAKFSNYVNIELRAIVSCLALSD